MSICTPFILFSYSTIFNVLFADYKTGFGGQYGVQADRVDKSAVGWDHSQKVDKHNSQKGKDHLIYAFHS